MNTIDNPFLAPLGSYPPATVRLKMASASVIGNPSGGPDTQSTSVVPWQPGTPPGVLVPIVWQVTDIFFRVEVPSSSGNITLTIDRYTGAGTFVTTNTINSTPVTIIAGNNEPTMRPPLIDLPLVNSGDKLQASYVLGSGQSGFTTYVVLTQKIGS